MDEMVWTLIGLLAATTFGNLYWLGARIDRLGVGLGTRIDALGARIDGLGSRVDGLESRIDGLAGRVDALDAHLTARIDALAARFDEHLSSHRR
jgi:hypothetical protein